MNNSVYRVNLYMENLFTFQTGQNLADISDLITGFVSHPFFRSTSHEMDSLGIPRRRPIS